MDHPPHDSESNGLPVQPTAPRKPLLKSQRFFVACLALASTAFLGFALFALWTFHRGSRLQVVDEPAFPTNFSKPTFPKHPTKPTIHIESLDRLDPLASVKGMPTFSAFDNLRDDTKYITSWLAAGWTNDVMTYGNLIYLGIITDRVPILGPFTGSPNTGPGMPPMPVGQVFDLPRFRKAINRPVLEWRQVKDAKSPIVDHLGCWSAWMGVQQNELHPRGSETPWRLNLDLSYTPAPDWIKLYGPEISDYHSKFWGLAALSFPNQHSNAALEAETIPSPDHNITLKPNDHLLCFDYLYYVAATNAWEYERDYSPAWRHVLKHMRWTDRLEKLADYYVRLAIGVRSGDPTPPYITIHARHTDFANPCHVALSDCFAPLSVIARRVREVQNELAQEKGIQARHVFMTSDEKDPVWWEEVAEQGWLKLDHASLTEEHGRWYPILLDAIIQSSCVGFVGNSGSTMSLIASRRVRDWHNGVTKMVKWGSKDADEH